MLRQHLIAFDLETIPDLAAVARVHGIKPSDEEALRTALGKRFPREPYHQIVCLGMLHAERDGGAWMVRSLEVPHAGAMHEADLIRHFASKVAECQPRLVSYHGASFDLPVLRYRAMINRVAAPGLSEQRYYRRYSPFALDLCDVLSSYQARGKVSLDELCRILGVAGKPDGMNGARVDEMVREGRLAEVATYCASDVVATFRLFLIYEVFCGRLAPEDLHASSDQLSKLLEDGGGRESGEV